MITDCILDTYYPTQLNSPIGIYEKYVPEENPKLILKLLNKTLNNKDNIIDINNISSTTLLPLQTNNIQYHPNVLNQQQTNGCVAYTITSMIEYYQKKNLLNISLSAQALYYYTRELEGTTNQNTGTYPNDAFKITLERGIPKEIYHDNSTGNLFVKPSEQAEKDAFINKIDAWKELNFYVKDANKADIISEQIANGDVVGISVHMNSDLYYNNSRNGIIDVGSRNIGTNHQLMVIDYKQDIRSNDGKRLFLVQNSWGKKFGIKPEGARSKGFVWFTESYIQENCYYGTTIDWGKLHSIINSVDNKLNI